jgi:hypothetical protein
MDFFIDSIKMFAIGAVMGTVFAIFLKGAKYKENKRKENLKS